MLPISNFKIFISASVLLVVVGLLVSAAFSEKDKQQKEFETYYKVYSINAPKQIVFANEKVPMHEQDVQESFDREILTNTYWQSQTILLLKRANKFFPVIESILSKNGIPDDMKYVVLAESGLQNVVSPAGASGYWQFIEATAKIYGLEVSSEVDERYHVVKSTEAACKYFKEAYKQFNNWALVAASYNMGIEGLRKQLAQQGVNSYYELLLNAETARYVYRILAIKEIAEQPQKYGFHLLESHLYYPVKTIKIKTNQTIPDLIKYSLNNGTNYKTLKLLNPWLRSKSLTVAAGKTYFIELPKNKVQSNNWADKIENDTIPIEFTNFN
ncbi:MAG: lytic transglycosylase domain-containing protein [Bacteroidia bacterium]|nr:lytic transglycosylase domain-containing protein [Bacteroidia bacterium]